MITHKDLIEVELTDDDLAYCRENPARACEAKSTGQLHTLGSLVLQRVLNIDPYDFAEHAQAAKELGAAYVCEIDGNQIMGLNASVSVIKNNDVLNKRLFVPSPQLFIHPSIDRHYTVGIFVYGHTNDHKELCAIDKTYIAGFIETKQLRYGLNSQVHTPFYTAQGTTSVTAVIKLSPMPELLGQMQHHHCCV